MGVNLHIICASFSLSNVIYTQVKLAVLKDRLVRALGPNSGVAITASPFQQVNVLPEGSQPAAQQQQNPYQGAGGASRGFQVQSGSRNFQTTTTSTTNYYNQNQFSYAPATSTANTQTSVFTPQPVSSTSAPVHKGNNMHFYSNLFFCIYLLNCRTNIIWMDFSSVSYSFWMSFV